MRISAGLVDDSYQKFSQVDRRTESLGINLETQIGASQQESTGLMYPQISTARRS